MAFTKSFLKPPLTFPAVSGDVCSFVDKLGGFPLKAHEVSLVAKQAAGTPSPSSPLPISGWDAIHIGNISDNTNISYFKGVLNGTYGFVDLGDISWSLLSSGRHRTPNIPNMYSYSDNDTDFICSTYRSVVLNDIVDIDKSISLYTSGGSLYCQVNDSDLNGLSGADFKDAVSGILIYKLATPTTPSFTSAEFEALCEAFGMNGQYVEIQIGSTVYGCTFDAITGILTVTHIYIKPTSTATISSFSHTANNTWIFVIQGFSAVTRGDAISNINIVDTYENTTGNGFCKATTNYPVFSLNDADNNLNASSSATDIRTAFANFVNTYSPEAVYELASPQEIQLFPAQILTLKNNNIWADTGATSLQYIKIGR